MENKFNRKQLNINTPRLQIKEFDLSMAQVVLKNSQEQDVKTFTPDEYFHSEKQVITLLQRFIENYQTKCSPLVYPVFFKDTTIGYVQIIQLEEKQWEIGYHIAKPYTRQGYATEALSYFLPVIMKELNIDKVYAIVSIRNKASISVLIKCGFYLSDKEYKKEHLVYEYKIKKKE